MASSGGDNYNFDLGSLLDQVHAEEEKELQALSQTTPTQQVGDQQQQQQVSGAPQLSSSSNNKNMNRKKRRLSKNIVNKNSNSKKYLTSKINKIRLRRPNIIPKSKMIK